MGQMTRVFVTPCWKQLGFGLEMSRMMMIDLAGAASATTQGYPCCIRTKMSPFPVPFRMVHVTLDAAMIAIVVQTIETNREDLAFS
jgi:hypothetical protein